MTIADRVADVAITASINTSLAADKELSALKINVDTRDGNVLLRGTAPNADARDRAAALARETKGVGQVDNQLEIRP